MNTKQIHTSESLKSQDGELEELIEDGSVKPYEQKHSVSKANECVGA